MHGCQISSNDSKVIIKVKGDGRHTSKQDKNNLGPRSFYLEELQFLFINWNDGEKDK